MKRRKWLIIFKLIPQRDGLSSEFLYWVKFSCALHEWKGDKDKFKLHMRRLLCSHFVSAIILLKTRYVFFDLYGYLIHEKKFENRD